MSDPAVFALQGKLDAILAELNRVEDSAIRRKLLAEMRGLMAELDHLVLDTTRLHGAKPQRPK
jgi:hypothetical protein